MDILTVKQNVVPHSIVFKDKLTALELYEQILSLSPKLANDALQSATTSDSSPQPDNDKVRCPKCGSTQLDSHKRGFSVGKAAAGVLFIPGGALWGLHGRNKIEITCLKCGNKFKAGKGA